MSRDSLHTALVVSAFNSGALAPEWRFWDCLWCQKNFEARRKILKNKVFPVLVLENLEKILELEIWEKLSHKNGMEGHFPHYAQWTVSFRRQLPHLTIERQMYLTPIKLIYRVKSDTQSSDGHLTNI